MYRTMTLLFCLLTFQPAWSASSDSVDELTLAIREATTFASSADYLRSFDEKLTLAHAGEYGRLSKPRLAQLQRSRDRLAKLLEGYSSSEDLSESQRVAVFNEREQFAKTLRERDKDRIVCKRAATTGTRLAKTECMTVAQREERAAAARREALDRQRGVCSVGEGNLCAR
jgi:hypothetical protein